MAKESQTAIAKVDPRQASLKDLFERSKGAIAQVVPKHLTADRILKVALTATSRTPKLLECSQNSILQSVMHAAQLGLEPGSPLGHAYLVPYKTKVKEGEQTHWRMECQLIVGYRGLIELARRSQQIDSIEARVVYERDVFRVAYGLNPVLEHQPTLDGDPGKVIAAYAVARIKNGLPQAEVMTRAQIERIKASSKTGGYDDSPWAQHFDEMARKTVVRRICKYLPLTVEARDAIERVDAAENIDHGALAAIPIEIHDEGNNESPLANALKHKAEEGKEPTA